jgi:hypothetical protein
MRMRKSLLFFIVLLMAVSLACEQSGRILTPEEATAEAQEGVFRPGDGESAAGANFAIGDSATVIGSGFLINLLNAPGGRIAGSQSRGSTVEILESAEFEGDIWYHVDSETGEGWLRAENLEAVEGESEGEGEAEGEGEGEGGGDATASGPAVGDTVYLVSNGFLVNLLREPNGTILAVQERGVSVTIVDVFEDEDGTIWYLIDAPTGEGWVAADNISVEAP